MKARKESTLNVSYQINFYSDLVLGKVVEKEIVLEYHLQKKNNYLLVIN